MQMWIDAEGRVRRSVMDVPPENLRAALGSDDARLKIEQEMYEFGAPVTVDAPPADNTVEIKDLEELTRSTA